MDIALHDILGSFGSILIATAYLLIQIEYWRADDLLFSAINAVGAAMIFYNAFMPLLIESHHEGGTRA